MLFRNIYLVTEYASYFRVRRALNVKTPRKRIPATRARNKDFARASERTDERNGGMRIRETFRGAGRKQG